MNMTALAPSPVLGYTEPRLWTPPLRELTPETSVGFEQIKFAREVLNRPADPWQEWALIHAGELLPDGRPRFRVVIITVARQNGKTELLVILSAYWQFIDRVPLILGTSTKLDYAKESWEKQKRLVERCRALDEFRDEKRWAVSGNNRIESWTKGDEFFEPSRYKIAAATEEGGRSLTVHRLICDELRQHHSYKAWGAAEEATSAVSDAQIWGLSNAGDDRSVVLNDHRQSAIDFIETGQGDYRLGLFEWSAPEDCDPTDIEALRMANPNLGRRKDPEALLLKAKRAMRTGGEALSSFKTESLCIRVRVLNPAIDPAWWRACLDPGTLDGYRRSVACCLDVAPDGEHVTLLAAVMLPTGQVRVEPVEAWTDTLKARKDLRSLIRRVKPRVLGWFPNGPAAALAASLQENKAANPADRWPPSGVTLTEIRGDMPAACMGLVDLIKTGQILHSGDPLLDAQVGKAELVRRGDAKVFVRGADDHVDAVYAMAGAVQLAMTLPPDPGPIRIVVPTDPFDE